MRREELDFIGALNMCDEISNEAYKKIMCHCEEQEPCEDAISREAAIRAIEALQRPIMREASAYYQFKFSGMSEAREVVANLPSVTPQPKTGHWEWVQYDSNPKIGNWHCSECRTIIPHMPVEIDHTPIYKWCPMCGRRMESEVQDADND